MTSEYLRYFIEICDCGSIQSASKKLFVSSQGLGQAMQRIEKSIGLRLLERTQNGVTPTEFGRLFYEQACAVDREMQKLERLAEDYKRRKKTRIAVGVLGKNKFMDAIQVCASDYIREHPDTMLDVCTTAFEKSGELLDGLWDGSIDIGWMYHWRTHKELKYYTVNDYSRLVLLTSASNPLAGQSSVSWTDIKNLPLVSPGEQDPFTDLVRDLCRSNHFTPNNVYYTTENNLIASLIDHNIASIILRESYAGYISRFCDNAKALPFMPEIEVANSLFIRKDSKSDGDVRSFLSYMLDYFRKIMGADYRHAEL